MRAFTVHEGIAAPLDRGDVDTDQIIPAVHLRRVERTGFGPFLFEAWRQDPSFVLNDPRYAGASILVTGPNFGSGSSREHAVWALEDHGFRAVIAPSFADIFRSNCTKVGVLPVQLSDEEVRALLDLVIATPGTRVSVDLGTRTVRADGFEAAFAIDDFTRWRLMEGLDDIGLTLRNADAIDDYESRRDAWLPRVDTSR